MLLLELIHKDHHESTVTDSVDSVWAQCLPQPVIFSCKCCRQAWNGQTHMKDASLCSVFDKWVTWQVGYFFRIAVNWIQVLTCLSHALSHRTHWITARKSWLWQILHMFACLRSAGDNPYTSSGWVFLKGPLCSQQDNRNRFMHQSLVWAQSVSGGRK